MGILDDAGRLTDQGLEEVTAGLSELRNLRDQNRKIRGVLTKFLKSQPQVKLDEYDGVTTLRLAEMVASVARDHERASSTYKADATKRSGEKECPETGGTCQHRETCDGANVITCWARHARLASEPEGRTTGLHRDSMG